MLLHVPQLINACENIFDVAVKNAVKELSLPVIIVNVCLMIEQIVP
jgi:hypothetical protein